LAGLNLEKVQASLDAVCPKCGKVITPAEVQRIDFERIECPACGEWFAPQPCVVMGSVFLGFEKAYI